MPPPHFSEDSQLSNKPNLSLKLSILFVVGLLLFFCHFNQSMILCAISDCFISLFEFALIPAYAPRINRPTSNICWCSLRSIAFQGWGHQSPFLPKSLSTTAVLPSSAGLSDTDKIFQRRARDAWAESPQYRKHEMMQGQCLMFSVSLKKTRVCFEMWC